MFSAQKKFAMLESTVVQKTCRYRVQYTNLNEAERDRILNLYTIQVLC